MIVLDRLSIHAGAFALRDVSFTVPTGRYAVLMGATGSGKTTILEAVLGLRNVSSGAVWLHGENVTHKKPSLRGIGFVPQDGALFRTMTIYDQIALGLIIRRETAANVRQRVTALATRLGISHLLERRPQGLSGGERQRVALGRALSFAPQVLCLDEPLSALDDATRGEMIQLLKQVQQESGVTVLHVTHHQSEAEQLADVRLELRAGQVAVRGA
jgi:molybdate/tungstate transport system ATP-binding protein